MILQVGISLQGYKPLLRVDDEFIPRKTIRELSQQMAMKMELIQQVDPSSFLIFPKVLKITFIIGKMVVPLGWYPK